MLKTPDSYISYFTPGEMTHDTLEFILVKRQKLAERLVDRVRESVLTTAKYQSLLLGPRGIGKSYMVALVYHRVKELAELDGKIAIAWLPEDEWSVASLVDLYFVILEALEKEYGGLRTAIDALYETDLRERTAAAADLILSFVGERTLFLLVENLEEIFRGLTRDELWSFRSFLSKKPFATILATTPSLFNGIDRQDEAFFGFFQKTYLEELSAAEATELLGKLAERRDDKALRDFLKTPTALDRVQAVHDLAGGHPRLYLLFAHLLSKPQELDELVTPFLEFLDELTPFYQDRMKTLSPQQRKIVAFLSDRRGAVAVKEMVARTNGLTSQTASGQLDKLEEMGYVRKNRAGRESHYELREPLLRMVIEKKRGRGELIRLVVDFLRRWYSRDERNARLKSLPPHATLSRQYWEDSLDLNLAIQDTPDPRRAAVLSPEYQKAYQAREFDRAAEIIAEIIERKGYTCVTEDWFQYANCLYMANKFEKALIYYDKAKELYNDSASIWFNRGNVLYRLGRFEDALASYFEALEIAPTYASAWFNFGIALYELGQYSNALDYYLRALKLNPNDATIWNSHGSALYRLGHYLDALVSYNKASELDPSDATIWNNQGLALGTLLQYEEALIAFDKALKIEPKYVNAWINRGVTLQKLGHYSEALESYDQALMIDPKNAKAWFNRGEIFLQRNELNHFLQTVEYGFAVADPTDYWHGNTKEYCYLLFQQSLLNNDNNIATLIAPFAKHDAVAWLAQGLIENIPVVIAPDVSQERAEAWLTVWQAAGEGKPDLVIPLRLLAAAVAWKPKRDIRALLALPLEERRILQRLLSLETENAE